MKRWWVASWFAVMSTGVWAAAPLVTPVVKTATACRLILEAGGLDAKAADATFLAQIQEARGVLRLGLAQDNRLPDFEPKISDVSVMWQVEPTVSVYSKDPKKPVYVAQLGDYHEAAIARLHSLEAAVTAKLNLDPKEEGLGMYRWTGDAAKQVIARGREALQNAGADARGEEDTTTSTRVPWMPGKVGAIGTGIVTAGGFLVALASSLVPHRSDPYTSLFLGPCDAIGGMVIVAGILVMGTVVASTVDAFIGSRGVPALPPGADLTDRLKMLEERNYSPVYYTGFGLPDGRQIDMLSAGGYFTVYVWKP